MGGGSKEPGPIEEDVGEVSEGRTEQEAELNALISRIIAESEGGPRAGLEAAGLDLETGTFSRGVLGPGRANIKRRIARSGIDPNSPAALQTFADFEATARRGAGDVLSQRLDKEREFALNLKRLAFGGARDPLGSLGLQADIAAGRRTGETGRV